MKKENVLAKLSAFCMKYGQENGYKGHRIIVNGYQEPKRAEFLNSVDTVSYNIVINIPSFRTVNIKVKEATGLQIILKEKEIAITGA